MPTLRRGSPRRAAECCRSRAPPSTLQPHRRRQRTAGQTRRPGRCAVWSSSPDRTGPCPHSCGMHATSQRLQSCCDHAVQPFDLVATARHLKEYFHPSVLRGDDLVATAAAAGAGRGARSMHSTQRSVLSLFDLPGLSPAAAPDQSPGLFQPTGSSPEFNGDLSSNVRPCSHCRILTPHSVCLSLCRYQGDLMSGQPAVCPVAKPCHQLRPHRTTGTAGQ